MSKEKKEWETTEGKQKTQTEKRKAIPNPCPKKVLKISSKTESLLNYNTFSKSQNNQVQQCAAGMGPNTECK